MSYTVYRNGKKTTYKSYEDYLDTLAEEYEVIDIDEDDELDDYAYGTRKKTTSSYYGGSSYGSSYSSSKGWGYKSKPRSWGYGYGRYNAYDAFKSLKDSLLDTLRFLWIDLDLEGALPSEATTEFVLVDAEEVPTAIFSDLSDDISKDGSKRGKKLSITLNKKALAKSTMSNTAIKTLVTQKVGNFYHPFYREVVFNVNDSQRGRSKAFKLLKAVSPFTEEELGLASAEDKYTAEGYVALLKEYVSDTKISRILHPFLSEKLADVSLGVSDKIITDHKESYKFVLDNKETLPKGVSSYDIKVIKDLLEYTDSYEKGDKSDKAPEFPYINFIATLHSDLIFFPQSGQKLAMPEDYMKKLKALSDKGNKVASILFEHYSEDSESEFKETVKYADMFADLLAEVKHELDFNTFIKNLEELKKDSYIWAIEQHRFTEFEDKTSGQRRAIAEAAEDASETSKEECGVTGNSEKAKEEKKKKAAEGDTGGHGYGDGAGEHDPNDMSKREGGEYGGPAMEESSADADDISYMFDPGYSRYIKPSVVFDKEYEIALNKIKKIFVHDVKHKYPSASPTKRISPKKLGLRKVSPAISIYKRNGKPKPILRTVNLICDMSGSMSGFHEVKMLQLIGIFSDLARSGHVKGRVILSLPSGSLVYKLPVDRDTMLRFGCVFGTEGFEQTMRTSVKVLKKADFNFCITDGHITDMPIQKKYYNAKGIETIGVYVGDQKYSENLLKWFDKSVLRGSLNDLANEMVVKLKK